MKNSDDIERLRLQFVDRSLSYNQPIEGIPYGYVYMITDRFTGDTYVGQRKYKIDYTADYRRSHRKGWRRYLSSGKDVHELIKANGEQSVIKTFICYVPTKPLLDLVEEKLIRYGKTIQECSMNHAIAAPFPNTLFPEECLGSKRMHAIAELRYKKNVLPIKDTIINDFNSGISTIDISKKYSIGQKSISRCLRENNVDVYRGHSPVQGGYTYTCAHCGIKFTKHRKKYGKHQYCSNKCLYASQNKSSALDVDKLMRMYTNDNMSLHDIEKVVDVSYITVYNVLRKAGVKFRKTGRDRKH